jgi:hypothetical protein
MQTYGCSKIMWMARIIDKLNSEGHKPYSIVSEDNTYEFHCCMEDDGYRFFICCYEWPSSKLKYRTLPK